MAHGRLMFLLLLQQLLVFTYDLYCRDCKATSHPTTDTSHYYRVTDSMARRHLDKKAHENEEKCMLIRFIHLQEFLYTQDVKLKVHHVGVSLSNRGGSYFLSRFMISGASSHVYLEMVRFVLDILVIDHKKVVQAFEYDFNTMVLSGVFSHRPSRSSYRSNSLQLGLSLTNSHRSVLTNSTRSFPIDRSSLVLITKGNIYHWESVVFDIKALGTHYSRYFQCSLS